MGVDYKKELQRLMRIFNGSFINSENELILEKKFNLYFCLDISTVEELQAKVLKWVTRSCIHGVNANNNLKKVNEFLDTNFSKKEITKIYEYLGNDCNPILCDKFIKSGFDIEVILKFEKAKERISKIMGVQNE